MNRPVLTIKKNTYGTMWKSRTVFQQVEDQLRNDISLVLQNYSSNKADAYNENVRLWMASKTQLTESIQRAHDIFKSVHDRPQAERLFETLIENMFSKIKVTLSADVLKLLETAAKDFKGKRAPAQDRPAQVIVHRK